MMPAKCSVNWLFCQRATCIYVDLFRTLSENIAYINDVSDRPVFIG